MEKRTVVRTFWWMVGCVALTAMALPSVGFAQDEMTFGEEEVEEDVDFDFSVDDAQPTGPKSGPTVTGIIIATDPGIDPSTAQILTDILMLELDKLTEYQSQPNGQLVDKFAAMGQEGAAECAFNPICIGRVGGEVGVERLVIGRLTGGDGSYDLNMDLVNVSENAVEYYVSRTVRGDVDDLEKTVIESIPRLFRIRKKIVGGGGGGGEQEAEASALQTGLAWGTLGLAVVSLGAGLFFGLDASSTQSDLENGEQNDGVYTITQREAQSQLDDAEGSAQLANIFFGVGLAAGVASVLLFTITFGEDIATDQQETSELDNFRISPAVSPDGEGVGFSAGFDF
ncbi:MAG: hypothetical protein AAFS10_01195 [Myxococcota bacterium]